MYERDLGLLLDDLEDLPELLHPVVLGERHLLPRLRHRRPLFPLIRTMASASAPASPDGNL